MLKSWNKEIINSVSSLAGIEAVPHRFGGTEFRVGKVEVGHIHTFGLLDIPFPVNVKEQLILEGFAEPHHILPDSGWISFYIKKQNDVNHALWLLNLSYIRYVLKGKINNKEALNRFDKISNELKAVLEGVKK